MRFTCSGLQFNNFDMNDLWFDFNLHNFYKTEAESNKYLLPEQLEKDIDARTLPELSVFFPDHPIKAAMESYLTRGQGLEPAGKSQRIWLIENNEHKFKPKGCFENHVDGLKATDRTLTPETKL